MVEFKTEPNETIVNGVWARMLRGGWNAAPFCAPGVGFTPARILRIRLSAGGDRPRGAGETRERRGASLGKPATGMLPSVRAAFPATQNR